MRITVILCTYNRCLSLATALNSVAASQVPSSIPWEVLVIDNNSSDRTRDVVEDFSRRNPGRFRYLFEARQGKSFALNRGVREASGDVLAFMDDDVTVEPSWLTKLTAPLQSDRWAGAGGRVIPLWNANRPKWLFDAGESLAPLVSFNAGEQGGKLHEPPFGTNMAFRKKTFEKYGDFRTDMGPRPDSAIRGEDTEFGRRVLNGGEQLYYEPAAVVYHPVTPDRLTKRYFLRWWFDKGRAQVLEFPEHDAHMLAGIPLYLFKRLLADAFRWTVAFEPSRRFDYKRQVWGQVGEITERCRLALGKQGFRPTKNRDRGILIF
jgi:glycosyltransferase involved in cell wall biosynthesis